MTFDLVSRAGVFYTFLILLLYSFVLTVASSRAAGFDYLWPPNVIGQAIVFLPCGFFYLLIYLSSFFSSPNLSHCRLDVYHTSTHGAALVRISDAGLKRAARGSLQIQDAKNRQKIAIWAPSHNFVGLYLRN